MIYAAETDQHNVVMRVICAPSIAWCVDTLGGRWVETFIDGSQRGKYAGPGDTYDEDANEFIAPVVDGP